MAQTLFKEILHVNGLLADIVLDQGVQFVYKLGRAHCKALKVAVDFSSGYHAQSNGQMEWDA